MFKIEENSQKVGAYIRRLIRKRYDSERKFCKAYLELQGMPANDEETRKMQNRFSQILNGKKSIQTHDLPFVTELLGVSCEEILSAGKRCVPVSSHVTNYNVASSEDSKVWQEYIEREDKLILNYDEYGKSVLDYAFEFRNYKFLKYLTDNGYIKFHESNDTGFMYNFGADTIIKRRDSLHTDVLKEKISCSNKLRMNMLTLAIENGDFSVLDMLRARETPMLHFAALFITDPKEPEPYDYSEITEIIASATDEVIDYFATEYSIVRDKKTIPSCFLYQHLGDIIVAMIRNNDMRVIRIMEKAIEHNNNVLLRIKEMFNTETKNYMNQFNCSEADAEKSVIMFNKFYESCDVVRVSCFGRNKIIVANIIRANVKATDIRIKNTLSALNTSYDMVRAEAEGINR
ncbi:MAG: hypothetical protein K6B52_04705 [Clostridiales bacterium]|nr:hypothetical protein [Clostridiales bacterium]